MTRIILITLGKDFFLKLERLNSGVLWIDWQDTIQILSFSYSAFHLGVFLSFTLPVS